MYVEPLETRLVPSPLSSLGATAGQVAQFEQEYAALQEQSALLFQDFAAWNATLAATNPAALPEALALETYCWQAWQSLESTWIW